jgi:hypothetical protein
MKQSTNPRFPVFGTFSVLPPVLIGVMWRFFEHSPGVTGAGNGYAGMFMAAFLYVGTGLFGLAGVASGIVALVRRERCWFLGVAGILGTVLVCSWLKKFV